MGVVVVVEAGGGGGGWFVRMSGGGILTRGGEGGGLVCTVCCWTHSDSLNSPALRRVDDRCQGRFLQDSCEESSRSRAILGKTGGGGGREIGVCERSGRERRGEERGGEKIDNGYPLVRRQNQHTKSRAHHDTTNNNNQPTPVQS